MTQHSPQGGVRCARVPARRHMERRPNTEATSRNACFPAAIGAKRKCLQRAHDAIERQQPFRGVGGDVSAVTSCVTTDHTLTIASRSPRQTVHIPVRVRTVQLCREAENQGETEPSFGPPNQRNTDSHADAASEQRAQTSRASD